MSEEFEIDLAPEHHGPGELSIDEATELVFKKLKWPSVGGPSGRGWSYASTAQRCPRLFQATYDRDEVDEAARQTIGGGSGVPVPLQVGGLYHTLHALYEAAMMRKCGVLDDRGGLFHLKGMAIGAGAKVWKAPPDAVETFLAELKAMVGIASPSRKVRLPILTDRKPSLAIILEAERLFDAHALYWNEIADVTPLAIELFARDPLTGFTCRYDSVGLVGKDDKFLPPGVYVFERKTTRWIDENYLDSWTIDGEILGQIHCWHTAKLDKMFGPLQGVVMDVVSKGKTPECRRFVIPPNIPMAATHARWVRETFRQIEQWRASKVYPQHFSACFGRFGKCSQWNNCALGLSK